MRFFERKELRTMLPQPTELLDLFSTDHRRREAVAAAERLRGPGVSAREPRRCCAGSPISFRLCPPLRGQRACRPHIACGRCARGAAPSRSRLRSARGATGDRRTESGIEVKPVYTAADAPARARAAGRVPLHPRAVPGHVPRAGRGRSGSTPASPRRRSRTRATATSSSAARPASRSRSTCRRSSATTPTTRVRSARSAARASRSTRSPTWRSCSPGSRSARSRPR